MDQDYNLTAQQSADYEISPADASMVQVLTSKRVLIFSTSTNHAPQTIANTIRLGLEATIQSMPFLAGYVAPLPDAPHGPRGNRHIRGGGSVVFKVRDLTGRLSLPRLCASDFPPSQLQLSDVMPWNAAPPFWGVVPVCAVQATFIEGGLLLAICINHVAMDGTGITTMVRTFAENCRRAQSGGSFSPVKLEPASLDRKRLFSDTPGHIENHSAYAILDKLPEPPTWLSQRASKTLVFRFPSASLAALKKASTTVSSTQVDVQSFISTHDALLGLVWRSIVVARHAVGTITGDLNQVVMCTIPVNYRHLVSPPLPETYIGNAFLSVAATASLGTMLSSDGPSIAAHAIRRAISTVTAANAADYVGTVSHLSDYRLCVVATAWDFRGTQIYITSYRGFDHASMDWGDGVGKYEAFRLPDGGLADGCPIILPYRPDGDSEVQLTLDAEVMKVLTADPVWTSYSKH